MVDWQRAIQGIGSSWYLREEESDTVMPSEGLALSPTSGNKGKKKAVIGRKENSKRRAQSSEEDRNNAAVEPAIEEEKKNGKQELVFVEDKEKQFHLAMEGLIGKLSELKRVGKETFVTSKLTKNVYGLELSTLSKPQKAHVFASNLSFEPPILCANLKRPAARSLSSFGDLFLIRKSVQTNLTINEILLQILENVEVLTKVTKKQSDQIK